MNRGINEGGDLPEELLRVSCFYNGKCADFLLLMWGQETSASILALISLGTNTVGFIIM